MDILYFSFDFDLDITKGVKKKIIGQVDGFKQNDVKIDLVYAENNKLFLNSKELTSLSRSKISNRFNFFKTVYKHLNQLKYRNYNNFYFRYNIGNPYLFLCIMTIKILIPNTKIFVEIPTYPYKGEINKNLKNQSVYFLDFLFQRIAKYFIDFYVTFSEDEFINGVKCIKIKNGIKPYEITFPIEPNKEINKTLTMIGVAGIADHTGYDKIINGLFEYNKKRDKKYNLEFNIVGKGSYEGYLKKLVKHLNLEESVKFLGFKEGKELEGLYLNSDIGVSNIALYRRGKGGDSMKAKEYLQYGLPILVDTNDNCFEKYALEIPEDISYVDIDSIINFYDNWKENSNKDDVAQYAKENFSWKKQTKSIVKQLKK